MFLLILHAGPDGPGIGQLSAPNKSFREDEEWFPAKRSPWECCRAETFRGKELLSLSRPEVSRGIATGIEGGARLEKVATKVGKKKEKVTSD